MAIRVVLMRPGEQPEPVDLCDDLADHYRRLRALIGGTLTFELPPDDCPVPDVQLLADDNGRLRRLRYTTLGLVGPVVAYRRTPDGEVGDLSDGELAAVARWMVADRKPVAPSGLFVVLPGVGGKGYATTGVTASGRGDEPPVGFRLPPHVVRADAYEAAGGDFSQAQLHFTGLPGDRAERALVQRLLDKYGVELVAYADERTPGYCGFPPGVMFSLELLFAGTPTGEAAMRACLDEYQDGPRDERRKRNREKKRERQRKRQHPR